MEEEDRRAHVGAARVDEAVGGEGMIGCVLGFR